MSRNNQKSPFSAGTETQRAILKIKADASQEAFPSEKTIFCSKMTNGKSKFNSSKAGNK